MMNESTHVRCKQCGTELPDGTLCPRCLMAEIVQPTCVVGGGGALPPFAPAELAPHFPQLEILECLGRGGMGVVYKARQKSLNRLVALKLLAPERAGESGFAERFAKEAQALAALSHPNIVAVHDFGEAGGFFYLLMEFVDGVNLRQLLQTRRLTPQEALSIVPPICDALQCAHSRGIVHRDIKPENLLMDRAGTVKIADFGIAKMVASNVARHSNVESSLEQDSTLESRATFAFGTPDYAAPEQRSPGAGTDHRADIYSLGVVLYEMLTGERPKDKFEPPSRRVQVDIRIDEIVLRALEHSPELRFATVEEFRTQVNAVRHSGIVKQSKRHHAAKWAAAIAVGMIAAGAYFFQTVIGGTRNAAEPSGPAAPALSPEQQLVRAVAEIEETYSARLTAEKEAALDSADTRPADAERQHAQTERGQRIRELTEREAQLQRLIESLAGEPPAR